MASARCLLQRQYGQHMHPALAVSWPDMEQHQNEAF